MKPRAVWSIVKPGIDRAQTCGPDERTIVLIITLTVSGSRHTTRGARRVVSMYARPVNTGAKPVTPLNPAIARIIFRLSRVLLAGRWHLIKSAGHR
ncbi:hypothetical protein LPB41_05985 [Thalassospira sp. MA62]|nr:hypothetical protein [Thalassospira sp. MA62]